MMKRKIYAVGETVYDIIFKNAKPVDAKPGGALLNTAVSLGRLGTDVWLIGDIADDVVGEITLDFLEKNNVKTDYIYHYDDAKSRLALAFLNDDNNAKYSFYKIRTNSAAKLIFPEPHENDIILFGSYYGMKHEIREDLVAFLTKARQTGAIIVYDPNFRAAHRSMLNEVMPMIQENMKLSHIIKGSDEDFLYIFGKDNAPGTYKIVSEITDAALIYTANRHGVWLNTKNYSDHYDALAIDPVSTIGAGDTFMAGVGYSLVKNKLFFDDAEKISKEYWDKIIKTSIEFSGHVCMHYDNYVSTELAEKYKINN
jgi:fructokinase